MSQRREKPPHEQADENPPASHGDSQDMSYDIQMNERSGQKLPVQSPFGFLIHTIVCCGWLLYLYLRAQTCIRTVTASSGMSGGPWIFWICEMILAGPELFQIMELSFAFMPSKNSSPRPSYSLNGSNAPLVHVFITTCGEQWDVILDTVAGAALQDYPSNSYRVFVLDDANDSSISHSVDEFNRKECEKLGIQPVIYLSRLNKSGIVRHHKAGNLEYGIRISREQYGGSEFIAGLDADMIPESDWLKRLVPHLLYSSKTAIVSPPQYFYNIPDTDHLAQDANVLQQVLEPVRDPVGCSMCHGSGYVMRRKALDDIGGWPLVNIGEDVLCSYQLNRAGWQTAFVQDKLQFGMAPQSFHAYVTQRMRWTAGNLLSARKFKFFLPYLHHSKITGVQRLHGMMQAVKTYAWVALIVPIIVLPVCLPLMGNAESRVEEVIWSQDHVRKVYIVVCIATKIWKRMVFAPKVGATNVFNLSMNRYWITPYIAFSFYQSFGMNLEDTKFEISGTFESPIDERSGKTGPAFWKRMTNSLVLMHIIYWLIASSALLVWVLSIGWTISRGDRSHTYLHTGLTVRLFEMVLAAAMPVWYMAFPPSAVERRDRLTRDHLGANRATTKTWARRGDRGVFLKDLIEVLIVVACDWV